MADYCKPDHFSLKAQKEAYPARSVYKLKEMDEKFGLLRSGISPFKVLDLGAAPGSWSLYMLRTLKKISLFSVDLSPLSRQFDGGLFEKPQTAASHPPFTFVQGDFTQSGIREAILSNGPYNLVVSDAAPPTTGNRTVDTLQSLNLAEIALDYAETALDDGGSFVVKVFQGGDTGALLKKIRALFKTGKSFKPKACRPESFETYYIGLGKNS